MSSLLCYEKTERALLRLEHEARLAAEELRIEDAVILGRGWRRRHSESEDELSRLKEEMAALGGESSSGPRAREEEDLERRVRRLEAEKRGMKESFVKLLEDVESSVAMQGRG